EIKEPAPVAESVFVERLFAGVAHERFPIDALGIDALGPLAHAVAVAVPGEMHLVDLAEPAGFHDLIALLNVRHAALLRAHLDDALVLVLGFDDHLALA